MAQFFRNLEKQRVFAVFACNTWHNSWHTFGTLGGTVGKFVLMSAPPPVG